MQSYAGHWQAEDGATIRLLKPERHLMIGMALCKYHGESAIGIVSEDPAAGSEEGAKLRGIELVLELAERHLIAASLGLEDENRIRALRTTIVFVRALRAECLARPVVLEEKTIAKATKQVLDKEMDAKQGGSISVQLLADVSAREDALRQLKGEIKELERAIAESYSRIGRLTRAVPATRESVGDYRETKDEYVSAFGVSDKEVIQLLAEAGFIPNSKALERVDALPEKLDAMEAYPAWTVYRYLRTTGLENVTSARLEASKLRARAEQLDTKVAIETLGKSLLDWLEEQSDVLYPIVEDVINAHRKRAMDELRRRTVH